VAGQWLSTSGAPPTGAIGPKAVPSLLPMPRLSTSIAGASGVGTSADGDPYGRVEGSRSSNLGDLY